MDRWIKDCFSLKCVRCSSGRILYECGRLTTTRTFSSNEYLKNDKSFVFKYGRLQTKIHAHTHTDRVKKINKI